MMSVPKAGVYGFNWFNVWYTPGVSKVSTSIRDDHNASFELSNRGNLVAVVSDSTRVLGDGDVSPSGGLGVMEGKAFLMKYLGGVDAVALCINSRGKNGEPDPEKIIDFVKMVEPSFGAVNLEDISQPNCFKVLDDLREACDIPVWHDDAQGTACVTLAGLINAVKVVGKDFSKIKVAFFGAGASNTTCVRLILKAGADPAQCDRLRLQGRTAPGSRGYQSRHALLPQVGDLRRDQPEQGRFHRRGHEGCRRPDRALHARSRCHQTGLGFPSMAKKSIVFACANPVPEIYPYAAKEAGAYVVATGRGDFPNQVNNSLGFPGILKGALMVRAEKITDEMAIAAAYSMAATAEKKGITPEYITPLMSEWEVFPTEARDVAMQAIKDGVARVQLTPEEVFARAEADIRESRALIDHLMEDDYIKRPPISLLENALKRAIDQVK